jgi:hypothetical protein
METIEERAMSLMNRLNGIRCQDIRMNSVINALKEQDKITRHACADVVLNQGGRTLNKSVRDDMHRKIMNTKSV